MSTPGSVSVILVSKDRPSYLSDALGSLLPQNSFIKEIIIFDKSEVHDNQVMIDALAKQHGAILYQRDPLCTTSALRNEGLSLATGEYLCFLDDDDYLFPDYLKSQLSFLQNGASLVFCNYITARYTKHPMSNDQIASQFSILIKLRTWTSALAFTSGPLSIQRNSFAFIASFVPIIHGALFRKDAIDKIRFSEQMVFCEDIHFWILFYRNNVKMAFNTTVLAMYRIHDHNWSAMFNTGHNFDFYNSLKRENAVTGIFNQFVLNLKLLKLSDWGNRISYSEKMPFWKGLFSSIYYMPYVLLVIPYFVTLKYQNYISKR